MSATQELIAAALARCDLMTGMLGYEPASLRDLREACARAMVQPAAPDMAERDALIADNERLMQIAAQESDVGARVLREVFALCEDTQDKCSDEPGDFARGRRFEAKGIARAIGAWYQEEFCGRSHMGEPAAPAPDHFRDAAKMAPVHCTPTEHDGRIVYEHTSEPIPNADGFVLYAAPAPDRFRAAAKMMAVQPACMTCSGHGMVGGLLPNGGGYQADPCPDCAAPVTAEVPMPEPVAYRHSETHDLHDCFEEVQLADAESEAEPLMLGSDVRTYGEQCRAAGYAAGGKDTERLNFMDRNLKMRMGWSVGVALAGNVSIQSVISTRRPTSIRDAIDAALRGEVE